MINNAQLLFFFYLEFFWFGEPSDDMLPKQSAAVAIYDTRIPQRSLNGSTTESMKKRGANQSPLPVAASSPRASAETTELTRSFGWYSSDSWTQHDVQELCRVMFDALEHKFRKTQQADLINTLYQGKMIDYVRYNHTIFSYLMICNDFLFRCMECKKENIREDTFLDIPLPIRPFGKETSFGSVEEALEGFVEAETLDGANQYACDNCGKKCDTRKGLKLVHIPYLLTLHLMRFDFDYNSIHRLKLNDK
jgi:ubiquitin carboxyl-terminal hydrolase 47